MTPSWGASAHLGTFLRVSPPAGSATALGLTFWVPTHALNYLVTYFESVSAFLSHPAPCYPGRDLPLESYLPQRRLGGGRSTSRVKLPYTGTITMALKPPFLSLYRCPGLSGPDLPTASLPPWFFLPMGIGEPHRDCLALALFDLATTWLATPSPRRRFLLAMLALGVFST